MTPRMIDGLIERYLNALDALDALEMARIWGLARWYPELGEALLDVITDLAPIRCQSEQDCSDSE